MAYLAALAAITVLDGVWLGYLARDFYAREAAGLLAESVRVVPAGAFYLGYPAALIALALNPPSPNWRTAALRSALAGLFAYGTYDLTNLATLRGFSTAMALVDMAWGTVLSTAAGLAAHAVLQRLGLARNPRSNV